MLKNHHKLCELIPHERAMCLLDSVTDWDDEHIECSSSSHLGQDNPLLDEHHRLNCVNAIEYGAQAAAIHGILVARKSGSQPPTSGVLVQVKNMHIKDCDLTQLSSDMDIHARRIYSDSTSMVYTITINCQSELLLDGRIMIFIQQ
jgi:predicted hotdog family 3-hydroxylacyl-ACP dehydratase